MANKALTGLIAIYVGEDILSKSWKMKTRAVMLRKLKLILSRFYFNITNIYIFDLILQDFLGLLDTANYCRNIIVEKKHTIFLADS